MNFRTNELHEERDPRFTGPFRTKDRAPYPCGRDLLRDLEAYGCGEVASALELLRCPVIENRGVEIRRRGKEYVLLGMQDGEPLLTGAVFWFDRHARVVRTATRVIALGRPA